MTKKEEFLNQHNLKQHEEAEKRWLGLQNLNKKGTLMTVIKYYKKDCIRVRFEDDFKYEKDVNAACFKRGTVTNPYDKTVFGVGVIGEAYTVEVHKKHKQKKSYNRWCGILERCYSKTLRRCHQTYADCKVCDEWLFYPNFEKWFDEHYYEIPGCRMDIDKDLKVKGNRIYGPDTCLIVPSEINMLPISNKNRRNGVIGTHISENGRYEACHNICHHNKLKRIHLGTYDTPEDAFKKYKESKKLWMIKVADKYKKYLPKEVYEAVLNYEVDIND